MVIKLAKIKQIVWFLAILFIVLAFPLQVYSNSPLPSLIPYCIIFLLFGVMFLWSFKFQYKRSRAHSKLFYIIIAYLLFFTINIILEFVIFNFSVDLIITNIIIYILPTIFYFHFRRKATDQEIRWALYAMVTASLLCGIFFVYDSYMKLALGRVSDYAKLSFEYSLARGNQTAEEANNARVRNGYRSFGLLESHSVSGAWLVLGLFASLTIIPIYKKTLRMMVILLFGIFLLIGLNFTAIITYLVSIILFEFRLISLFRARIPRNIFKICILIIVIFILIIVAVVSFVGEEMTRSILDLVIVQRDFLFGLGSADQTQSTILSNKFMLFVQNILDTPFKAITGDIKANGKGGDVGFFDSITTFGFIFYFVIIIGLLQILKSSILKYKVQLSRSIQNESNTFKNSMLQLTIYIITLVLITDLHYSVWHAKSILPIVFFGLALYDRNINGLRISQLNG